jgi:hypothetical protein
LDLLDEQDQTEHQQRNWFPVRHHATNTASAPAMTASTIGTKPAMKSAPQARAPGHTEEYQAQPTKADQGLDADEVTKRVPGPGPRTSVRWLPMTVPT